MPSIAYLKNKENIYRYRKTHPVDKALQYKYCKTWVANNREKYNEICKIKQRRYDGWKRIQKTYLNILL